MSRSPNAQNYREGKLLVLGGIAVLALMYPLLVFVSALWLMLPSGLAGAAIATGGMAMWEYRP